MESLAVKYRPKKFEDVCSQTSIIRILNRQIQTNQLKNCYLFCGASGCGKTTTARIFANAINGGYCNPIEIDGASNNGVDNVREIIKSATERAIDSKYKIYIIDECHALTNNAWQAFLKCIEEPPTYTIFIFCTTDPQKIPATILNRVMRFNFTRISSNVICERLKYICKEESFYNYEDTCDYISRICKGGMRDGISLLEKCASYDMDLSIDNCLKALGNFSYDTYFKLVNNLIDGNEKEVIQIIESIYNDGNDLRLFIDQFLTFTLDISKYIIFSDCSMTSIPINMEDKIKMSCNFEKSSNYYNYLISRLLDLKNLLKQDTEPKSTILVKLMGVCRCQ